MSNYGLGGVFQVGDFWHVRYSQHGRQIRESTAIRIGSDRVASEAKARKFLQKRLTEIKAGDYAPGQDRVAIETVLDDWLENQKLKGIKAIKSATCLVNKHLRRVFKGYRAARIAPPKLRVYVSKRIAEGAKPASIRSELIHLHAALVLAVEDGRLSRVPKFPTVRVDSAKQGFIEPADFVRLHAELPNSLKDLATFLYWSGWRSGEAKSFAWSDVSLDHGQIHLRGENSKNRKGRILPIFGAIKEVLERRHAARRARLAVCVLPSRRASSQVHHSCLESGGGAGWTCVHAA
jgi:integrase